MSEPKVIKIDIDKIHVGTRLRAVDQAEVGKIAISMGEIGQISPVEVRDLPGSDGQFILVAGAHRLNAAQTLQWTEIDASLFDGNDDDARLREIDENLCRHELTPFDQANFLAERREIWERVHGNVKRGGDKRSKGQSVPLIEAIKASGFFAATAKKFGLNEKTVKRALTRKAHITPELWAALGRTDAAKNGALLDKLRKISVEDQREVAALLKERGCTIDYALREVVQLPTRDPDQAQLDALISAWSKAGEKARKQFLAAIKSVK